VTGEIEANRLRDELTENQQQSIDDLKLSRQETIDGLAMAIDLHDSATGSHAERMAVIAAYLGKELGLPRERVELLRAAAPMHDAGKIGTPAEILRKEGPLTEEERSEMQRHTVIGHRLFSKFESELSRLAATIAVSHHERYDGRGYPRGLRGEEIPLEGRITAVADVFDAVLSDRSYRKAMSPDEAAAVIREGRGAHFDPGIADALLENLSECLALRASVGRGPGEVRSDSHGQQKFAEQPTRTS
jgi:putative two-component system response regulator